jgi:hypothetical protein
MPTLSLFLAEPALEDDVRSLRDWLVEEPKTRHLIESGQASTSPGRMGTAMDIVQLSVSGGLDLAALALAYVQWRKARRIEQAVMVKVSDKQVILVGEDPDELVRQLKQILEDGGDAAE